MKLTKEILYDKDKIRTEGEGMRVKFNLDQNKFGNTLNNISTILSSKSPRSLNLNNLNEPDFNYDYSKSKRSNFDTVEVITNNLNKNSTNNNKETDNRINQRINEDNKIEEIPETAKFSNSGRGKIKYDIKMNKLKLPIGENNLDNRNNDTVVSGQNTNSTANHNLLNLKSNISKKLNLNYDYSSKTSKNTSKEKQTINKNDLEKKISNNEYENRRDMYNINSNLIQNQLICDEKRDEEILDKEKINYPNMKIKNKKIEENISINDKNTNLNVSDINNNYSIDERNNLANSKNIYNEKKYQKKAIDNKNKNGQKNEYVDFKDFQNNSNSLNEIIENEDIMVMNLQQKMSKISNGYYYDYNGGDEEINHENYYLMSKLVINLEEQNRILNEKIEKLSNENISYKIYEKEMIELMSNVSI